MTPFLKQVAEHYYAQENPERLCFVFPNRRAKSFFRKWYCEQVKQHSSIPRLMPSLLTMEDLFLRLSGKEKTERTTLLLELYKAYGALNPKAESLDDFIFWGDVILADFDDVDKYLIDAKGLFTNVSDFKSIQDTYEYLTEEQIQAIERFLSHFKKENGEYKLRFLQIWNILYPLYRDFNSAMDAKAMSYEGKTYRSVAEKIKEHPVVDLLQKKIPECSKFVFVGLNALNECEKMLLRKLRDASLAEFCWDYSSSMIKNEANKSSFFLGHNIEEFHQAFRPDSDGLPTPGINVLSVPSGIGMAKQIPEILRRLPSDTLDLKTAIVLPDEGLLLPVLNSIPENIQELNVTMGYPMNGSEFWSLVNDIASLQLHLRQKNGKWHFYHKQVWSIFSNSLFKCVVSEEGKKKAEDIKKAARYYIPQEDFAGDPVMESIFQPAVTDSTAKDRNSIHAIEDYLQKMTACVASRLKDTEGMNVEMDFARLYHKTIDRLRAEEDLTVLPSTFFKLLGSLVAGTSVPFEGEPLKGLQIMGPLETRALDFDNLIVLSCNEGVFPHRSVSSSFIPPELRKGFGLPTYEYQDAMWAYYFYRMIQRASTLWMLVDSRTEGVRSGEESRYIKQLELHFGAKVNRYVVKAPIDTGAMPGDIPKTEEHIQILKDSCLSATSLQNYLSCPAMFFYSKVEKLKEDTEVSESLDAGLLGNVFHSTMETIYKKYLNRSISAAELDAIIKDKKAIRNLVTGKIEEKLKTIEISGRNIIFLDIICHYVNQALTRDRQLMDTYGVDSFSILGLEKHSTSEIGGFKFEGYLDRLDSFRNKEVRIVDYKTGKVTDEDFLIDEENAQKVVEKLFGADNENRPKIALQLYLYDRFISEDSKYLGYNIINSVYQTSRLFIKEVENVELNEKFRTLMDERLEALLKEISDTSIPWTRKGGEKTCGYCDFKMICGK